VDPKILSPCQFVDFNLKDPHLQQERNVGSAVSLRSH